MQLLYTRDFGMPRLRDGSGAASNGADDAPSGFVGFKYGVDHLHDAQRLLRLYDQLGFAFQDRDDVFIVIDQSTCTAGRGSSRSVCAGRGAIVRVGPASV